MRLSFGLFLTFHLRGQQRPADGEFKEAYPNGQLRIYDFYNKGKADSTWTFYFADGKASRQESIKIALTILVILKYFDKQLTMNGMKEV